MAFSRRRNDVQWEEELTQTKTTAGMDGTRGHPLPYYQNVAENLERRYVNVPELNLDTMIPRQAGLQGSGGWYGWICVFCVCGAFLRARLSPLSPLSPLSSAPTPTLLGSTVRKDASDVVTVHLERSRDDGFGLIAWGGVDTVRWRRPAAHSTQPRASHHQETTTLHHMTGAQGGCDQATAGHDAGSSLPGARAG